VGLINQTPTQEKPNAYIRKIKTAQFIDIFEQVGLMNQAPTEESIHEKDQNRSVYLYNRKGGFDKSNPYRRIKFIQLIWIS